MSAIAKLTGKQNATPAEWYQHIKTIEAEIQTVTEELSIKRTEADRAQGLLSNTRKELEFYTTPAGRNETRVYPSNRKADRERLELEEQSRNTTAKAADDALKPIEQKHTSLVSELKALMEDSPTVTKADLKKSYSAVTALEQKLSKIKQTRQSAIAGADDRPINALRAEFEKAQSAHELAASGVALGEAVAADVKKAEQHLKQVRAKITEAEDATASQKAAVSGYGRRIESVETELGLVQESHRIMIGLFSEALQRGSIERINQAIESIKTELVEVAQADSLMRRFGVGNHCVSGDVGLEITNRSHSNIYGVNTGRLYPGESEIRGGIAKLLVGIGYPMQPESDA